MCGIAGVFKPGGVNQGDVELVQAMNAVQAHRGPDAEGIHQEATCILGHRRLAIIDLSADGRQPFSSPCGRYHMVFNGEIYNYIELRRELEDAGRAFRTKTDTEVLLAAYLHWGADCLHRLNGMFAFAIHDALAQTLFLARDRFGVKPLYYVHQEGFFAFASEIKALLKVPGLSKAVNNQALFDYMVFNRTDIRDETFFASVSRLTKGCRATLDASGFRSEPWWEPASFLGANAHHSLEQAAATVEALLVSAVELRMRSDVLVGSCLSGGLDSSILVGIVFDRLGAGPDFSTFTAAFPGHTVDETRYVDQMQARYPFKGHRVHPTADAALADLPALVYQNDEPTTGAAIYAQYEVMRLARQNGVTVLLDGQGGDEAFAGYQYFHGFRLYGLLCTFQPVTFARELAGILFRRQDFSSLQTLAFLCMPHALRRLTLRRSQPLVRPEFFEGYVGSSLIYNDFFQVKSLGQSLVSHYQYKLEHLLRTEDRNSMAFSIESRVPFLDYRLVEYVLGLPDDFKIHAGETKYLQKRAAGRYVTPGIMARKDKLGFATPMQEWMGTPRWQALARESCQAVAGAFPGAFDPAGMVFDNAIQCWKVIQLAHWHDTFVQ